MIESIRLRNWKTHSDSLFEFGKGTNVLVGAMGSGKSSVMDAVSFALFGTFPALQARRLSLEEVISSKPNQAEEALIELVFSYAGKRYNVERKIKRKGSTEAKVYCEGRFVAGPKPRDVNAAVEKSIEIGYNLFSRAVYSEQNEIDYFLRLSPKDRKSKFDELLELEKYETVRANAVTALNRLKALAKDKKAWVEEQKASLPKEEEKALLKGIREKEDETEKLRKEAVERRRKAEALEKEVHALEEEGEEFHCLKERLGQSKAVLEELKKTFELARKETGGKSKEDLEKEKSALLKGLDCAEKLASETQGMQEEELGRKNRFGKEAALGQKKVEELGSRLNELQAIGAHCPVCRQKLEPKTRDGLLKETGGEMRQAAAGMEQALKKEAESNARLAELKKALEKALKEKECVKENLLKLEHLRETVEKAAEKEKEALALSKEVNALEEKILRLKFDEKNLLEKRKQALEEKMSSESAKKSAESNSTLVNEMKLRLESFEKTRRQIAELEAKTEAMEESSEKMNYFINSLMSAQAELRETLIATINEAMHDIWQRVYPYSDFVSARMQVAEGSYELQAKEQSGKWVRVEGILSGGERSAAAVCIRIAFSLVLASNLSWLILDEPTHNLDRKAVETLSRMMQQHLPSLVEQVFVITHDTEMKKAASASLYLLEREKNQDAVTRPVLMNAQD